MKSIANCISILRMFISLLLLWLTPFSITYIIVYYICGVSDVLDGHIARRTNSTSSLGSKLDSLADFIFTAVLMFTLYPLLNLTMPFILWILIIITLRLISILIVIIKYETFAILHSYGNKTTGAIIFIFLPLIFTSSPIALIIPCSIASLSALEEILIHLTYDEFQSDRKSIFTR